MRSIRMSVVINKLPILSSFSYAQQQFSGLEAIDYFFAKEMSLAVNTLALNTKNETRDDINNILAHVFIALSVNHRAGHTCLAIYDIAGKCLGDAYDDQGQCSHQGFTFPDVKTLLTILDKLELSESANKLLVFAHQNLYMRRYYHFETELEGFIKQRLVQVSAFTTEDVSTTIQTLFPTPLSNNDSEVDWQKVAVANALNKNFSVIAGGPGTGKTYTVTKLLAALIMLTNSFEEGDIIGDKALNIALVAPTGKAAQRLSESIINAVTGFKEFIDENVLSSIPTSAQTIHRLLGVIPHSPNFRHHQDNLLSCDVLLVDEVSMVDLSMMTRLFRALKPDTKVILLGDADQLPSVAVGSVLADIAPRPHQGFSQDNYHYLAQACQLSEQQLKAAFKHNQGTPYDYLSILIKSRRFDGEGGIGKLATSVIAGDAVNSWQLLNENINNSPTSDSPLALVTGELTAWLLPLVKQYYQGISKCTSIEQAFELLAKFRVLCVTRQGEHGVDAINQWITTLLSQTHHFGQNQQLFHGMPIMISENDYQLGLFNGDIGLLWHATGTSDNTIESQQLMAFFEQKDELAAENNSSPYKTLLPSRLPKFTTVYAMTIHKTQGSEFEHVAMVLPKSSNNQLLSRELLYTGITRAKKLLTVASNQQPWQQGVTNVVKRNSGFKLS